MTYGLMPAKRYVYPKQPGGTRVHTSRRTRNINLICVCLVILAGCTRMFFKQHSIESISRNIIIFALFIAAVCIWAWQIQIRILRLEVRRNLICMAALIVFWMTLRTIKYGFTPLGHFTEQYAWYLYYVPVILIPLLMFLSVLYIGTPQNRLLNRKWNLLYIPAAALVLGVLTNDLHQLAFRFPGGIIGTGNNIYTHGPVYYLCMAWMVILFLAILFVTFKRCAVLGNRNKIWIPIMMLAAGLIYVVLFIGGWETEISRALTVPELGCFYLCAWMETLICIHLFPSNDRYGDFFHASSICTGISDEKGKTCYESARSISVSPEQIGQAQETDVYLHEGKLALRSHEIHGGFGYWLRDLEEVNQLNRQLEDLGDVLEEENSILDAENRMEEEKERLRQKNRLYDCIARDVSERLDRISALIDNPPDGPDEFKKIMTYACVLCTYIKRRSNLLLLGDQHQQISSDELRLAILESLEYVRLYGVSAQGFCRTMGMLPKAVVLNAYEIFEEILESALLETDAILVNLKAEENLLQMRITVSWPGDSFDPQRLQALAKEAGMNLSAQAEEDTQYITLDLPAGGQES